MDSRICHNSPYGQHIKITCVNHPEKKWSTKNIICIGARSLFYKNSWGENETMGKECNCALRDLVHNHQDD